MQGCMDPHDRSILASRVARVKTDGSNRCIELLGGSRV